MRKSPGQAVRQNNEERGEQKRAPRRVLIAEDDPVNHELLRHILRNAGFESLSAQNGLQALACLQEGATVDLILMDAVMPVCDGLSATREIRKNFDTPILGITAQANLKTAFLKAGADAVVIKPFTNRGLLEKIRETASTIKPESLLQ